MKLAIYDFDGTYMKTEVLRNVYAYWRSQKLNQKAYKKTWRKILIRNLFHKLNLFGWTKPKFRANAMSLTADLFRSIPKEDLDIFLDNLYIHLQQHINQDLKQQLKKDKTDGYKTVLLSGNFDVILKPFLQEGFDYVIGSEVCKDNQIIKSDEVNIIIHDKKAKTIIDNFPEANLEDSKAYADSYYDLPILDLVGHPIAYNPDNELYELALEREYEIWQKN